MEKKIIKLEEVKSEKVIELIKNFAKDVLTFQSLLNVRLDKINLKGFVPLIKRYCQNSDFKTRYDVYICIPYIDIKLSDMIFLSEEPYWPGYTINFKISILEITNKDRVTILKTGLFINSDLPNTVVYKEESLSILTSENIYNALKVINKEYEKWQEKEILKELISNVKISEKDLNYFMSLL